MIARAGRSCVRSRGSIDPEARMPVSFSELELAFDFVSIGRLGENEAFLDTQTGG
jgi:hypothetical protein